MIQLPPGRNQGLRPFMKQIYIYRVWIIREGNVARKVPDHPPLEPKMSAEDRIRFLLRVASRMEREGNRRMARLFRRMAEELRPSATSHSK